MRKFLSIALFALTFLSFVGNAIAADPVSKVQLNVPVTSSDTAFSNQMPDGYFIETAGRPDLEYAQFFADPDVTKEIEPGTYPSATAVLGVRNPSNADILGETVTFLKPEGAEIVGVFIADAFPGKGGEVTFTDNGDNVSIATDYRGGTTVYVEVVYTGGQAVAKDAPALFTPAHGATFTGAHSGDQPQQQNKL